MTMARSLIARFAISSALALVLFGAAAQTTPPTTPPTTAPATVPSTTPAAPSTAAPGGSLSPPSSPTARPVVQPAAAAPAPAALQPVPAPPVVSGPVVFGSQMFTGRFANITYSGFNPEYQIAVGDRVLVRLWGAIVYEAAQTVDAQGNIFVPNVGPVRVLNVRNADLNTQVEQQVRRTYRANVGVYASLEAAQPVKVYVTGFVRAPGLYSGLSSDSVLYYLDRAGGIDPDRGSYLSVTVQRGGKVRATIDLYKFLLNGTIETPQLQDGDTVVVAPRQQTISVFGEALNPYLFEFSGTSMSAADLIKLARPRPSATHISIVRSIGLERRSEYVALDQAANVQITDGDLVTFTADKFPATILVRVEGAQLGERTYVLPYGARLKDAVAKLRPAPQANLGGLQLFRLSVAAQQKKNLEITLQALQTAALSARSATSEEAQLRQAEAALILQFIDRARLVTPLGQVVLNSRVDADDMLLEDGDVLRIPENSSMVLVSGEVMFPNGLVFKPREDVDYYLELVGGYTQRADRDTLIIVKPNGAVAPGDSKLEPGDQIMVLPKVETKFVELTRAITSILYQLAISARVLIAI